MHSVASVRSAAGAANYFAKDDYYTGEHSSEATEWGGKGAEALGLSGEISKQAFEKLLNGKLPDGTEVNQSANRRAGIDLTFSMPKSASIMAYVAGDTRILTAHMAAVKSTMAWVERTMAETRDYSRNRNGEPVRTGNLVYALFQHDTSRKLDPQGHIHVVVASLTRNAQGAWRALRNSEIWSKNSTIGSAYHAAFREQLSELGYETRLTGKHGQFEIAGVSKEVIQEFSQRRQEILDKAAEVGISTPKGQDRIVVNTRDAKLDVEDRGKLRAEWAERAERVKFNGKEILQKAMSRSGGPSEQPIGLASKLNLIIQNTERLIDDYVRTSDALTTSGLARLPLTPSKLRTEMAVASAIRIHGQRQAAFQRSDVSKTALDLGLKGGTITKVEDRIQTLVDQQKLVMGTTTRLDGVAELVTTPQHIAEERKLLAGIDAGRKASSPIVEASQIQERLASVPTEHPLNNEQLAAATLALSTSDRIVVIQGVAGAGKTTLVQSIEAVAGQEGRKTEGLAFANEMVQKLKGDANIEASTVSSFVNAHIKGALAGQGPNFEKSKAELAGKIFVLDESSLVANEAMNNLVTIANAYKVDRLIMIGDRQQLESIDHGKAFALIQSHDPAMAHMPTSLRQTTPEMVQVATLTREKQFKAAFEVIKDQVHSEKNAYLDKAAERWLELPKEQRDQTALYASGRRSRAELNDLVQKGLHSEGTIRGPGRTLTTLLPAHSTREELRYPHTYEAGLVMDVVRHRGSSGLTRGRYEVLGTNERGDVQLRNERGKVFTFDPTRIDPSDKTDSIKLYEKMETTLYEGDKIVWTDTDKNREIYNSGKAQVLRVDENTITVENAKGEVLELGHGDKMLERLGLAYAINMHQAQGMTSTHGIGVMHSSERNLVTQRLAHVMVTRVRESIEIFTNDKDSLLKAIERNPGDNLSALETIGEKTIDAPEKSRSRNAGEFNPSIPGEANREGSQKGSASNATFEIPPLEPRIDLPERNIERTR